MNYLNQTEINQLLNKEDLTEKEGHAVSLVIDLIKKSLENYYSIPVEIQRGFLTALEIVDKT